MLLTVDVLLDEISPTLLTLLVTSALLDSKNSGEGSCSKSEIL